MSKNNICTIHNNDNDNANDDDDNNNNNNNNNKYRLVRAVHSGRAVCGMNFLRPLKHWDRGFESHLRHGCPFAFIPYLCSPVCR
jgi:hypothetical protein